MTKYYVTAEALDLKNFYGETSFDLSDDCDKSIAYGIPVKSKTMSVKLEGKTTVNYTENKKPADLFRIKSVKAGGKNVPLKYLTGVHFLDGDKTGTVDDEYVEAGVYYMQVGADPEDDGSIASLAELGVFSPTFVKLTVKGPSIKGKVKLDKTVFTVGTSENKVKIEINDKSGKISDKSKIIYRAEGSEDSEDWETLNGNETIDVIQSTGKHKIFVKGTDGYDGSLTLTYTVNGMKLTADTEGLSVIVNNGQAVPYNAAGYDFVEPFVTVKVGNEEIPYIGKAGVSDTYYTAQLKSVRKSVSDAGTVTLKFHGNYSGTVKKSFEIGQADLADSAGSLLVISPYSILKGDKLTAKADVYQSDMKYVYRKEMTKARNDDGLYYVLSWNLADIKVNKKQLKAGKDYEISEPVKSEKDGLAILTADIKAKDTDLYKGSMTGVEFKEYARAVKKVEVTAISSDTVSTAAVRDGKLYFVYGTDPRGDDKVAGTGDDNLKIYSIKVSYKKGDPDIYYNKELNPSALLFIEDVFDYKFSDYEDLTSKAKINVSFKDGKYGPTNKTWTTKFNVVSKDKLPK